MNVNFDALVPQMDVEPVGPTNEGASSDTVAQSPDHDPARLFKVSLADRPMPTFDAMPGRNRYRFDQIQLNEYMRFPYAPGKAEAKKLIAAAGSWGRKNFGRPVFIVEPEDDAICLWRTA